MIRGLDQLLEATGQPGLRELRAALGELLGEPHASGRVVGEQRLHGSGSISRVRLELDGTPMSVVAKRLRPAPAQRNRLIARRCLPAVGLEGRAPAILATAAERSGRHVWHVYEDLGQGTLETDRDSAAVEAAVRLLGRIHSRFIDHPLLAVLRECGVNFGPETYGSNMRDAIRCVEALSPPHLNGLGDWSALRDRLLERMWALRAQQRERREAIAELGGPETLLHGDMWHKNVSVTHERGGVRVRMIDWDHAGVGSTGYDLSTFLRGFPADERSGVLELYGEAVADSGWRLPSSAELAYVFQTFELARVANCVVWSALGAGDGVEGELEELQENEAWLASLDGVVLG